MRHSFLEIAITDRGIILSPSGDPGSIHISQGTLLAVYGQYNNLVIDHPGIGMVRELSPRLRTLRVGRILRRAARNLGFFKGLKKAWQIQRALGLPNARVSNLPAVQQNLLYVGCILAQGKPIICAESFGAELSPGDQARMMDKIKELVQQGQIAVFISLAPEKYYWQHYNTTIQIP